VQLVATGEVDQVSTGAKPVDEEVRFAVKVMVPAVCACANEPNNSSGSAKRAYETLCIFQPIASSAEAGALPAKSPVLGCAAGVGRGSRNLRRLTTCRQMKNHGAARRDSQNFQPGSLGASRGISPLW
jgi:hypothetical protein